MLRNISRKKQRRSKGVALIEGAIFLGFLMTLSTLFWDYMMVALSQVRHEAASVQLALQYKRSALNATLVEDPNTLISSVVITPVSHAELTKTTPGDLGPLTEINRRFNSMMDDIGSGAHLVLHNIATSIRFLDICQPEDSCAATYKEGGAHQEDIPAGLSWFLDSNSDCFSLDPNAEANFTAFVNQKVTDIIDGSLQSSTTTPSTFGTKMVDTEEVANIESIQVYLSKKPIIFWAACSLPPRFFLSAPVITYHIHFLDNELTYLPPSP